MCSEWWLTVLQSLWSTAAVLLQQCNNQQSNDLAHRGANWVIWDAGRLKNKKNKLKWNHSPQLDDCPLNPMRRHQSPPSRQSYSKTLMLLYTETEERVVCGRTAIPHLRKPDECAITAVDGNMRQHCTSSWAPTPPPASLMHHWRIGRIGRAFDSWRAKESVGIVQAGEKSTWRYVNAHAVVGDGVCAIHKGVEATGIFGNGCPVDPRVVCIDRMAGTVGAVAAAGGRSGGLSAMVQIVFGRFCLLRTCNFPNLNFF